MRVLKRGHDGICRRRSCLGRAFARHGLRGSVHPLSEQGSIDVTGASFPTTPSEMIGLEQREQTMSESQHRYLYKRLDERDVQGPTCALPATHFMAAPEVEQ